MRDISHKQQKFNVMIKVSKNADFHIQKVGDCGKVLTEPSANSVGLEVDRNVLDPQYAKYAAEYLHSSGQYEAVKKGSVQPYITNKDILNIFRKLGK